MTRFVVDASAGVEYLLRTAIGLQIAPLLEKASLFSPELVDVEIMSALRRAVLKKEIDSKRAALAVEDLQAWPMLRLSHSELVVGAWSHRDNLTMYDAFYVAAAKKCDAALLTVDGPLSRAPKLGIVVQNVRAA